MQLSVISLATLALTHGASIEFSKRQDTSVIPSGMKGSMQNTQQVQDTLNRELQSHDGHAASDVISSFITGADSQIDNAIATVGQFLAPVTLGGSEAVANVILGPFVQSVTNGAEVFISNLLGGGIDMVSDAAYAQYQQSVSRLSKESQKYGVDTSSLDKTIAKFPSKDHSKRQDTSVIPSGMKGSMQNTQQVQDTLNRELQSHDGHAASDVISSFITGADSQIDNAIATVGQFLAPVTLGGSEAVANVILGPFVQSVTNGAEVFISNLLGGGIDMVSDAAYAQYQQSVSRLSKESQKYGVNTSSLDEVIAKMPKKSQN